MSEPSFDLPGKMGTYLASLSRFYQIKKKTVLQEIVVNAVPSVHEAWDFDNWNGGSYGHALTLQVPEELYLRILERKDTIQTRIAGDLNKLNSSPNEYISDVFLEMEPVEDDRWREESGVYRPRVPGPAISPDLVQRIWGPGRVRVFLSHKARIKRETSELKRALGECGIAAFVAHEDIRPTQEWLTEIERALFTMDALVALLTEDYPDSEWTDQELGVALGRGVPVVAIRLGHDPYGFIGPRQGLSGCELSKPHDMATKLFGLLYELLPDKSRMFECALSAYESSSTFAQSARNVRQLLSVFERLTKDQVRRVLEVYHGNNQNRGSFSGRDHLCELLHRWTGEEWSVDRSNGKLSVVATRPDDVPF